MLETSLKRFITGQANKKKNGHFLLTLSGHEVLYSLGFSGEYCLVLYIMYTPFTVSFNLNIKTNLK